MNLLQNLKMMLEANVIEEASFLPPGWTWTTVDRIGQVVTGSTPSKSRKDYYGIGIPFVKPGDIPFDGQINDSIEHLSDEGAKHARIIPSQSILVTSIGATIGKTGFSKILVATNQQINSIVTKKGILPEFIFLYCLSDEFKKLIRENASATTLPIINKSRFETLPVPLAPEKEQKRIVAKIEALFGEVNTAREALDKLPSFLWSFRQSILGKAFRGKLGKNDPENESVQDILSDLRSKQQNQASLHCEDKIIEESESLPANWIWIRLENAFEVNPKLPPSGITNNSEVSFVPMKAVAELKGDVDLSQTATYEQVKNGFTKFIDGDVIMAKITPCMENGKIAIAKNLKNGTGFGSTEFHVFRPKSCGVLNAYLFFYFLQDSFRQKARMNMTGTAGQLRVPAKFMKDVMLPLPPTNEQKRITATITNLFQIANNVEENMKKAHRHTLLMKRVILSKAFRGELVPQDPNYEPASVLLQRIKNSANKT